MPNPTPRKLTHDGLTLTLKEWSRRTGINAETIRSRIDHQGYDVALALTTPVGGKFRPKKPGPVKPRDCPKYKRHASGQACARWRAGGREHARYFGPYGSPDAEAAYRRFQVEWAQGRAEPGPVGAAGLTVNGLVARYLAHVKGYYVKDGRPTSEQNAQKAALRYLADAAGRLPVGGVKGRHLKDCQTAMVAAKLARLTVNQHTWRITRCFRWGVGEDLVPPDVAAVLESVPNLQAGRSGAPENDPVMSVPAADVEKTLPHLHADPGRRAVLTGMVRAALLTGMRPGELCAMTAAAVDRSASPWCYRVGSHKNVHRQARRRPKVVWIGPRAQAVIAPFLADPGPGGRVWCFPPRGKGTVRTPVSRGAFAEFVRLACARAGVTPWHPHQLRHNRATEVQRLYEDDAAAAAVIGDTPQVAAAVYADPNEAVARRIAAATG